MNAVVEGIEIQCVKLVKQIQIEKELCNSLDLQLSKIKDRCQNIKENNKVKNTLRECTSSGIKCSVNNIQNLQSSLDVANCLKNELNKMMEERNEENRKKRLMEKLWVYEKQWVEIQSIYKKMPSVKHSLHLQLNTKIMAMNVKIKKQEINDIKSKISKYRNIKENRVKAQIINVANSTLKNNTSRKLKAEQREKLSSLHAGNKKIKMEMSALIGKQHNASSSLLTKKQNIIHNFISPPLSVNEHKFNIISVTPKSMPSPGTLSNLQIPELMIPPFRSSMNHTAGYLPLSQGASMKAGASDRCLQSQPTDANDTPPLKRKKEESISTPLMNIHAMKDSMHNFPRSEEMLLEQQSAIFSTCKPIIGASLNGKNISSEAPKDGNYLTDGIPKCVRAGTNLSRLLQKSAPASGSETTFNFPIRGFENILENETSGKIPSWNIDSKSKPTNVWDIFN